MSQKQHRKQLDRARAKRQRSRLEQRQARNRIIIFVMVFLMVFSLVGVAVASLFSGSPDAPPEPPPEPPPAAEELEPPPPPEPVDPDDLPFPLVAGPDDPVEATIETTLGTIVLRLDASAAPFATNSFIDLADQGFYDGVIFHRVIEDFMIQGGDPDGTGAGGPGYRFPDELEAAEALVADAGGYPRGTLAMANAGPDTNGSQFFIMHAEVYPLPPAYTVFGEVVDGLEVVDAIATTPTGPGDRPLEDVVMERVTVTVG